MDIVEAFVGQRMTADDVSALGQSILKNERDFNACAGFIAVDDCLPYYFKEEKLAPHNITFGISIVSC